jgi:hypothetical protein
MADMKDIGKKLVAMRTTFFEIIHSLEEITPATYSGKVVDISEGFSIHAVLGGLEGRINDLIVDFDDDAKTDYGVVTLKSKDGLDFIAEVLLNREELLKKAAYTIEEAASRENAVPAAERNSLANYLMMAG